MRIPRYAVAPDIWTVSEVEVAFQIPESVGTQPYGFYVRPKLVLQGGGTIQNYTDAATPFGEDWGKFSWQITWQPAQDLHSGSNMVDFVVSLAARLREGA